MENNLKEIVYTYTFENAINYIFEYVANSNKTNIKHARNYIKFLPSLNKAFPKKEIDNIECIKLDNDKVSVEIYINTYSLFGSLSPLPQYLVENMESERLKILQEILSMFNSQLLKWLPDLVKKYRHYNIYCNDPYDKITQLIASLIGINNANKSISIEKLIKYAGIIRQKSISKASIELVIRHYLNRKDIKIKEHIKHNVDLNEMQTNALGKNNSLVSENLTLGARIIDSSIKYAIIMKNISISDAYNFKNDKSILRDINNVIKIITNEPLLFDVHLHLRENEEHPFFIGSTNRSELSFLSWIGSGKNNKVVIIKGDKNE